MTWPFDLVAEVAWEGGTPVTFWTLSRTSGRYECDRILRRGLAGFNSVSESFAKRANWTEFHFLQKARYHNSGRCLGAPCSWT
jgi:hypothetical protein